MSTKVTAHVSRGVSVVEGARLRTWPQGRRCASEGCVTCGARLQVLHKRLTASG
jgi:hypothetical protein